MIGGCISNGWHGFKGDDLATTLYKELDENYEIHCILMGRSSTTKKYELLEHVQVQMNKEKRKLR